MNVQNDQEVYDRMDEAQDLEIKRIQEELKVSHACALNVQYLRTRHRHTPELEAELIALHQKGTPPDSIFDFGVTEQTKKALMDSIQTQLTKYM